MAIRFTCPCGLTLEAEEQYAGQLTVCPQCSRQKKIPSPMKPPVAKLVSPSPSPKAAPKAPPVPQPAADPGFEVVEDDEPIVAAPKAKSRPPLSMRDDDDRPVRKKRNADADDDRPRKPRAARLEEDDDDRPRKRRPKKRRAAMHTDSSARLWKILGGVALLLLGIGLIVGWWYSDARRAGKLLGGGVVCVFLGLGGIGTGMFGSVEGGSDPDDDDEDD